MPEQKWHVEWVTGTFKKFWNIERLTKNYIWMETSIIHQLDPIQKQITTLGLESKYIQTVKIIKMWKKET